MLAFICSENYFEKHSVNYELVLFIQFLYSFWSVMSSLQCSPPLACTWRPRGTWLFLQWMLHWWWINDSTVSVNTKSPSQMFDLNVTLRWLTECHSTK